MIHIHNGILPGHKKETSNSICSNMDASRDSHTSEVRERQVLYDTTYMWNIKYGTNVLISKTETDSQTWREELWLPRGMGRQWEGLGVLG